MTPDDRAARQRYASLIAGCLPPRPEFQPVSETPGAVQVERGMMLPMALCECPDVGRILQVADPLTAPAAARLRVIDARGHERAPYAGLLLYAWRVTFGRIERQLSTEQRGRWIQAFTAWADRPEGSEDIGGRAWWSLATNGAWSSPPRESNTLERLIADQQPSGAFLPPDRSRNPEMTWYQELVTLHALGAYAVREFDFEDAEHATLRAAEFHLDETQPDHATSEPWGLLAFILKPATRSLAEQMLHTVRVLYPDGATGVAAILLADVLGCLRELDRLCR
jgi:hypothetical protein